MKKIIYYTDQEHIEYVYNYKDNKILHNENGAAIIHYNKDGSIKEETYYLNGIKYDEADYYDELFWIKNNKENS